MAFGSYLRRQKNIIYVRVPSSFGERGRRSNKDLGSWYWMYHYCSKGVKWLWVLILESFLKQYITKVSKNIAAFPNTVNT